jgi:hypothetical protein
MSACIRALYSSDQWAPGFDLLGLLGCVTGAVLLSRGDFRAPIFSLRVGRGDVELGLLIDSRGGGGYCSRDAEALISNSGYVTSI